MRYRISSHTISFHTVSSHIKPHAGLSVMLLVTCLMFGALVWFDQRPGQTQSEPPPIHQLTTYHQRGVGSNPDGFVALNGAIYFALGGQSSYSEQVGGLWRTDGTASGTTLVKAIGGVQPASIKRVEDLIFFKVRVEHANSAFARQLWRSDGTADGTLMLAAETANYDEYVALGEMVYFAGADGGHGRELWQTDGTLAGTAMVGDATAGRNSTYPRQLTVLADRLYFIGGGAGESPRLWTSDGTAAGTQMVPDAPPTITELIRLQEMLLFAVYVEPDARELWRYDGAGSVPTRVAAFASTSDMSTLGRFTIFADRLFFAADTGTGQLLWQSDGTEAGTEVVVELEPDSNSESISPAAVTDSLYYFKVYDFSKESDVELWRTDGTDAGTVLIDTYGFVGRSFENLDESPRHFAARDDTLYFISHDNALWQSDGTVDGTVQIETPPVNNLAPAEDGLYLSLFDESVGYELGYSDGTTEGTRLIKDIEPNHVGITVWQMASVNGHIYAVLFEDGEELSQLWMSESATTPAILIDDAYTFYQLHTAGDNLFVRGVDNTGETLLVANGTTNQLDMLETFSEIEFRFSLGNQILFTVLDEVTNESTLWRSDGTVAGTVALIDSLSLISGPFGPNYRFLSLGDYAVLKIGDILWRTDGTEAGTTSFDMSAVTGGSARFVTVADTVFYIESENQYWRSDGTAAGTVRLDTKPIGDTSRTVAMGTESVASTASVNALGNALYLQIDNQLWYHDGISTDIVQLTTGTALGAGIGYPYGIPRQQVGDTLYFARSVGPVDGEVNSELWKSDGTLVGTQVVKALGPIEDGPGYPGPSLYSLPSLLLYLLYDANLGWGLWRTDGTTEGTELLDDDFPITYHRSRFATTDTHIFFESPTVEYGRELWKSDGTVDGTGLLKDIFPGRDHSDIGSRIATDQDIFFVADDGQHGSELWRSDGTTEGTQMVVDLYPGRIGSNISLLEWADGVLYFSGNNGQDGQQLFSLVTVTPRSLPPSEEPAAPDAAVEQIFLPHINR